MEKAYLPLKKIFFLFLSWRVLLFAVAIVSAKILTLRTDYLGREFAGSSAIPSIWPWANFDGAHYLSIVTSGYGQFEYAFFPGYPLLISLLSKLWQDPLAVSFLLSNFLAIIFLFLVYKLWRLDYPEQTVWKGLVLFLVFPSAFYIGAVYGESLFLVLSAGSFLAARKGKYWIAGLLAALAGLTRLVGIFLLPALILLWLNSGRKMKDLWPILISALGFLAVLLFNFYRTGDPLYFVHIQPLFGAERSGGDLILLPQVLFRYLKIFSTVDPLTLPFFAAWQEFALVILALVVLVLGRRRLASPYLLFSAAVLVLPTLTGTLSSMPRYILAAFPLFIAGAELITGRWWFWLGVSIFFFWQVINVSLFVNGYWVS